MQKKKSKAKIKKIKEMPDYQLADAIMPRAKPGFKAGNPLIDENNEMVKRKQKKIRKLLIKLKKICP